MRNPSVGLRRSQTRANELFQRRIVTDENKNRKNIVIFYAKLYLDSKQKKKQLYSE